MPRKATTVTEPRTQQYDFKQSLVRTGYGHLPEDLRQRGLAQVDAQKSHWAQGFGVLHRAWLAVVDRVLAAQSVPKLQYATYKAYTNQYISKVVMKGSETSDMVVAKFTRLGADPGILVSINSVIGEVTGA